MAFSATINSKAYLGGAGGLCIIYGTWSGAAGDAAGTLSIGGKFTGSLWFKCDSTSVNQQTSQIFPVVQWDGGIPGNLTIQNLDNVTTGNFIIFSFGS